RLRAADDAGGSGARRRGARSLAHDGTSPARRAVSLLTGLPRRTPRREERSRLLARTGRARPRRETHGRDTRGLRVRPPTRAGRRRCLAASWCSVPVVSLVAPPRAAR